ncbi:N-acetyltransferase [Planctomycetales bacterium]|nr:N-acetyltransferase [Planctomycetales bacterium]
MVFDFRKTAFPAPVLPAGFWFVPWNKDLTEAHGDILHRSFKDDLDGSVFTTFRQINHCVNLIAMVANGNSFLSPATLLIAYGDPDGLFEYVANIQGLKLSAEIGAVQNVGVLPEYRKRGIGQALVCGALIAFKKAGVQKVTLEATADNLSAMKLYHRIGFTTYRTYFREIFP